MDYFKKIKGENIYLSPINTKDVKKFTEWMNDRKVTDNMGTTNQIFSTRRQEEALVTMTKEGCNFSIVTLRENRLIGCISFFDIDTISRAGFIGLFIGEAEHRNKGYGSEAIKLMLQYGFEILNFHNVMLKVYSFNEKAIHCYKKNGFKEIGYRREAYFLNGIYYDEWFMDILSTEYFSNKQI